ncbi:MAG: YbaN family protein [Rikenellaceae bacterium]
MKPIFIFLGTLSLVLGVVGIILPVLPTTPFLLLSATLYMHSSPRMYHWLLNHKYFGSYINNYLKYRTISVKIKVVAVSTLWLTIGASICATHNIYIQIMLFLIAVGVSWHILSHPSRRC